MFRGDTTADKIHDRLRVDFGGASPKAFGYLSKYSFLREQDLVLDAIGDVSGTVVDLACGAGLVTLPLVRTGARVIGVDFNEAACRQAGRNGLLPARGNTFSLPLANTVADVVVNVEFAQQYHPKAVEGMLWTTNASALGRFTGIPTTPLPVRLPDRVTDWPTDQLTPGTVFVWHWAQEKHLVDYAYGPEELLDALPLLGVDRVFSDGIVLKIGVAGSNGRDPSPPIILDTLLQETMQIISAYYDVHLHSTQNRLIYRKKRCSENGTSGPVLLRVFAVNDFDLPRAAIPAGADQLDFEFDRRAFRLGNDCLAVVPLPSYEISGL